MQLDTKLLQNIPLFKNIGGEEFETLFTCIGARKESFEKGDFILLNGDATGSIGIILSGRAHIVKEDVFGGRAIINVLGPAAVFGESFVCGGSYALTVSVQAAENSDVLFLPFDRVMNICPSACGFHNAMIKNMVEMIARKNLKLMEMLEVTTKHSLREKILTFLSQLAQEQGTATVTAPVGRADMADFLGADRSALTRELNRMRDAGLIAYSKNTFTLLTAEIT